MLVDLYISFKALCFWVLLQTITGDTLVQSASSISKRSLSATGAVDAMVHSTGDEDDDEEDEHDHVATPVRGLAGKPLIQFIVSVFASYMHHIHLAVIVCFLCQVLDTLYRYIDIIVRHHTLLLDVLLWHAVDTRLCCCLTGIKVPDPVFMCSIEADTPSKQRALDRALANLTREDPSLRCAALGLFLY